MKYVMRSAFKKGEVIPDGENPVTEERIAENKADEKVLIDAQIYEIHREAISSILEMADKVSAVTGVTFPWNEICVQSHEGSQESCYPTVPSNSLREKLHHAGHMASSRNYTFEDSSAFIRWAKPYLADGFRNGYDPVCLRKNNT